MSRESATPFTVIYAPELFDRLRWFSRLRWLAAAGLAVGAVIGPMVGFSGARPSLFFVALFVAAYNTYFYWRLRLAEEYVPENQRRCAVRQMVMDLVALGVTVHFTGGMASPLIVFFIFHMAIGTVMIATSLMYVLAGLTSAGLVGLHLAHQYGILTVHPLNHGDAQSQAELLTLLANVVALFTMVYLTHEVMSRFKKHSIQLHKTTTILSERSETLVTLLADMEEVERRKSHYMQISAHQLRSPLGTVRTSLEVLTSGFIDPSSERGRRMLDGTIERVDELLAIVSDLLELAKVREGRENAPWAVDVSLGQLITDIVDSLGTSAEERQLELSSDLSGKALLDWGVPPDLVHALENLVYNAIKYSEPGGKIHVGLRHVGHQVEIRVRDEGIGIPPEFLGQVFQEFVRAPNARKHGAEGTGLGLTIVREVVEAHGGEVSVTSEIGQGSEFLIRLPLGWTPPEVAKMLRAGDDPRHLTATRRERRIIPQT